MALGVQNLFDRARRALGMTQIDLAQLLGASRRTGQRWDAGESYPAHDQLIQLAKAVYEIDPTLATEIATSVGTSPEALGLAAPPPPRPAPPPIESVVDSVVCAAAEAIDLLPRAVRPALLAAFARARELQLDVESVERGLRGRMPGQTSPEISRRAKSTRSSDGVG